MQLPVSCGSFASMHRLEYRGSANNAGNKMTLQATVAMLMFGQCENLQLFDVWRHCI